LPAAFPAALHPCLLPATLLRFAPLTRAAVPHPVLLRRDRRQVSPRGHAPRLILRDVGLALVSRRGVPRLDQQPRRLLFSGLRLHPRQDPVPHQLPAPEPQPEPALSIPRPWITLRDPFPAV